MRKICLILALVLLALAIVGCGGDDITTTLDDTTATTDKGGKHTAVKGIYR